MKVKYLVLGAGISGFSFVGGKQNNEFLVLEQKSHSGGYYNTTIKDDYVWDYAGHFFHFQNVDLQDKFISKIGEENFIRVRKNIHELPKDEFIDCLYDWFQKQEKDQYSEALVMDPAYVHIKETDNVDAIKKDLAQQEIYTLERYGEWSYCSIEDCILSAIRLKGEIG